MASGYPISGRSPDYADYLAKHGFAEETGSAIPQTGRLLSMYISGKVRDIIVSAETLTDENIRAAEVTAEQLDEALKNGFDKNSAAIQTGITRLTYEIQGIPDRISDLTGRFHWGFAHIFVATGRMNDSLNEFIKTARTPDQSTAYGNFEIAREAFRQGLYFESLEFLDKAINGDRTSGGYKIEWRFHIMNGILKLGFVNGDMSLVDLAAAEESFILAGRYARADYPDHAAHAYLSAGWAACCQGKMKDGLGYTEQALAIIPNLGEALFLAAKMRMASGDTDSALSLLGKAIDTDRYFSLRAAGDEDFHRHDDILTAFLEAIRKEKYQQSAPRILECLEQIKRISDNNPDFIDNKTICKLEEFLAKGESWPLMDILGTVKKLDEVIAEIKRLPVVVTLVSSRMEEENYHDIESYSEKVVIKPARFFSKAVTEMQPKTRSVKKKREVPVVSPVSFDFCFIPAGTFMMGDNANGPIHQVTISKDYYLGKFPVTQSQWKAVMGNHPSTFEGANRPVENVSWDDCQQFIQCINALDKGVFRLPTEAEWEYACRAGSSGTYCFGDSEEQLGDYAWYSANSGGITQPVGLKLANAWGLHDMHGNVWEWCQDRDGDYPDGAQTDPQGSSSGPFRVYRGGSWRYDASHATSAYRRCYDPAYRGSGLGFRLLLES